MERKKITLPLTRELARTLHAGDQVLLTGTIIHHVMQDTRECVRPLQKGKNSI